MNQTSATTAISALCCTACGSTAIVKNGHNACGSAQFLCHACGARRVLSPKSRATEPVRKAQVLRAVESERLSLRATQGLFGVDRKTIAGWLEKKPLPCRH